MEYAVYQYLLTLTMFTDYPSKLNYLATYFVNDLARDDKFWENVLTCPASWSYYSTNHNDGVEDYFNQTDNGEF